MDSPYPGPLIDTKLGQFKPKPRLKPKLRLPNLVSFDSTSCKIPNGL